MNDNEVKFIDYLKSGCIVDGDFFESLDESKTKNCLDALSNLLNNMSIKIEPIIEELSLDCISNGYFYDICVFWVTYLYKCFKESNYDARNKDSVERAKVIYESGMIDTGYYLERIEDLKKFKDEDYLPERVIYHMSKEHRTLQQVFSRLVFYYLANKSYPSLKTDIANLIKVGKLEVDFWNLPLI